MAALTIPFEIHITVEKLTESQSGLFTRICRDQAGKPVFIELSRGDFRHQPMFSKVLHENDLEAVLVRSEQYALLFRHAGFVPKRLKIEVPFDDAQTLEAGSDDAGERYYEWHGKVPYERVERLLKLCEAHQVHMSRNALKDSENLRFITLREYGSADVFKKRVKLLNEALREDGRPVSKQHFEYCIFDTNSCLDKGWLIL